jgi:putative transposase
MIINHIMKYKLQLRKVQYIELDELRMQLCDLYNAAIYERRDAYEKYNKCINYIDQSYSLKIIRNEIKEYSKFGIRLQYGTLKQVDTEFKAMITNRSKKRKASYPRYKTYSSFKSFKSCIGTGGVTIINNNLHIKGFSSDIEIKYNNRKNILDKAKFMVIKKYQKGWYIFITYNLDSSKVEKDVIKSVGIDLGLQKLATLSDNKIIENPRILNKHFSTIRKISRKLSRAKFRSNNYFKVKNNLNIIYSKISNSRDTFNHQVSSYLINNYDLVALENLNLKSLLRSDATKIKKVDTGIRRNMHDVSFASLRNKLSYKAEKAGVKFILVDPAYTSQTCSCCGTIKKKSLSIRVHSCEDCGLVLNRDLNASINILNKAVRGLGVNNISNTNVYNNSLEVINIGHRNTAFL